jgi:spore coat protein U-like protein
LNHNQLKSPNLIMGQPLSVGGGGTFAGRRMSSGGAHLSYQLFSTASRSTVWGDGTAGTVTVSGDCPPGCETSYTVYGRIPTKQPAAPGTYIDTIVVTVTF